MRGPLLAFLQSWTVTVLMLLRWGEPWSLEEPCRPPSQQAELNSFLWTIKRDPPSYFYGTIHVPYTRVWDYIPHNSKQAFQQSQVIYFELDLTDPYTVSALSSCQLLPQGENLQDILPRDIYHRLKRHLDYVKLMMPTWVTPDQRGRGLYADYLFNAIAGNWERKRPIWVMLMVNSLTESDVKTRGVPVLDLYLAQEAERMRKRTGAVEKVEEQCHPLNKLNFSQVLFALNQTLLQQESVRSGSLGVAYTTEDLISHYNCGDLRSVAFSRDSSQVPHLPDVRLLQPSEQATALEIDSYFRQELIYKRNQRMGRRVKALLEEQPDKSFFFAFGAGHFLGNNTVIDVLRQQGYQVEHIPAGQPINSLASESEEPPLLEPFLHELLLQEQLEELGRPPEGSLELLLQKAQRRVMKKRRRSKQKKHRQRHFNELWVRMEDRAVLQTPSLPQHLMGLHTSDITVHDHQRHQELQLPPLAPSASALSPQPLPLLPLLLLLLWTQLIPLWVEPLVARPRLPDMVSP